MYKHMRPHKKFVTEAGIEYNPVATLKDNDGSVCHIVIDDNCYVCFLHTEESGWVATHYIFAELHSALTLLPTLTEAIK
jgi:hypothetical protein